MLKRHEVEILLKAGHLQTEVARLTGVSVRSVQRIAEEAPIQWDFSRGKAGRRPVPKLALGTDDLLLPLP